MSFIREFIRNPRQTGSVAASSAPVVRMMVDSLDLPEARRVVELGAGTGAVTAGLQRRLPADATLVAVELNQAFAEQLRRRFERAAQSPVVHIENRSAAELPALLDKYRLGELDAIASGLPWTLMSRQDQRATLDAVVAALAPTGQFVTLACLHQSASTAGRRVRRLLRDRFGRVERLPVVWAAVPPMIAYRCSAPIKRVTVDTIVNQAEH